MFFPTDTKKVFKKYGIIYDKGEQTNYLQAPPNETLRNPVQKNHSILVENPAVCLQSITILNFETKFDARRGQSQL
jgi:hypothetical protein